MLNVPFSENNIPPFDHAPYNHLRDNNQDLSLTNLQEPDSPSNNYESTRSHNTQRDKRIRRYDQQIDFKDVYRKALDIADHIRENRASITKSLTRYESHQVAEDEIERSLDLLENLHENSEYFQRRVNSVTSFLPRNQPLYALCCFGIVPSLMSKEVHVRPPTAMQHFFGDLCKEVAIGQLAENLIVSYQERSEFLIERTQVTKDPITNEKVPVTDAVIFTGTMENADKLRKQFHSKTLFIANGAGHNPIVVSEGADVERAVQGALEVQLYNQGQDCANPNTILVSSKVYDQFLEKLVANVKNIPIGPYDDPENIVGPISDTNDLSRIQQLLVDNARWIHPETPGHIHTALAIVEPTIICKPLSAGGNYQEQFAPIFFIQRYDSASELAEYFEDPRYSKNAMYLTLFGRNEYVESLVQNGLNGVKLHDHSTIIRNRDLHSPGVERGTQPYGGYGRGASCFSIHGKVTAAPTLPQRDIYEQLVKPYIALQHEAQVTSNGNDKEKVMIEPIRKIETPPYLKEQKSTDIGRINPKSLKAQGRYWADTVAEHILERFPDKEVYTLAAGISPSGLVHFGNFRDVMTAFAVCEELKERGKSTKLIFSWDDFDRFRKVPQGFAQSLEENVGMPLSKVPDPLGEFPSYASRFEQRFEQTMRKLGIDMEYRYQSQEYTSGRYDQMIIHALQNREKIAEILFNHMSDKAIEAQGIIKNEFISSFYPIAVYSRFTGKDNTTILEYDGQSSITYSCNDTGEIETIDLSEDRIAKLNWKIDWPMRWKEEEVVFEPGGKDHASPGGSYDVSSILAEELFDSLPPSFVGYEFIGIRGLDGKMSGSKGNVVTPDELLKIYEPQILKWLYSRRSPSFQFELAFDTEVFRHYDEFDRSCSRAIKGKLSEVEKKALVLSGASLESESFSPIPFRQAVALGQIVQWDENKMISLCDDLGHEYDETSIKTRLKKAQEWIESFNPERKMDLRTSVNSDYVKTMSDSAVKQVRHLASALSESFTNVNEINDLVYAIPKDSNLSEDENKKKQREFFAHVYQLLLGEDTGPRLSTFLWSIDQDKARKLLDI